ncbi:hypothetical protein AKO1_012915 [Acrasis kona]|uniref:FAD-binding domain-containing protein n=1 Tax=Acrasis kona TaxID=1008807 RepID=A0AAW2YPM3_9EUKA
MSSDFIIAGGGIGGIATAIALQKHGYNAVVFERDKDFSSRSQGYSLTIQHNGYRALEKLGVAQRVKDLSDGLEITGSTVMRSDGHTISSTKSNHFRFKNFIVSRQELRKCLLDALLPNTIFWGKEIVDYRTTPDGVSVLFSDGSYKQGRALIGCDGVRSEVSKRLVKSELRYLGVWAINGMSPHHGNELIADKSMQVLDGDNRVFIKPFNKQKCMWQLTFKVENAVSLSELCQDDLLQKSIAITKDWFRPVSLLISETMACDLRAGPIYDRDPLSKISKDHPYVTVLGDAIHPMSPFKGQGANQALCDSISLVESLLNNSDVAEAFVEYEREMLLRTRRLVLGSREAVRFLHTHDALTKRSNRKA